MQPFRYTNLFQSLIWPELSIHFKKDYLVILSPSPLQTISSALWGGGIGEASYFVNWKVPLDYRCVSPVEQMKRQIKTWGYPSDRTIGLQTAANLINASIHEEDGDHFRLVCCVTAGTSNAERAGRKRTTFSSYQIGTINLFLLIDGKVSHAAMVNGLLTATEAKVAALQDLKICNDEGEIATGTTTDSVVLAVSQSKLYSETHAYAGTATTLGNAIGRLVYKSIYEAVSTQGEM